MNVTNRPDINALLMNMRDIRSEMHNQGINHIALDVKDTNVVNNVDKTTPAFSEMLTNAIDSVNNLQQESGNLSKAYAMGDESVKIEEVMIAGEKARVGFQATLQVRNKLIEAYQDIMNMPI
ncbi:flagellar hook-basal body complex protein FliE [Sessilibacter corallicola]|uniref:Flagellar hook-basal body complex protein FliE n=1 Tax=Sessilibacter corallicola TaxID=2904075 RepID=A0ABQ0AAB1_9GAMM